MDYSLLLGSLTIILMMSGGQSESMSQSCSWSNGKMICETQKSNTGNMAGASSMSGFGPGGSYQDANAMTANSYTGNSQSSRSQSGNMPPGGFPGFPGSFSFPFGTPQFGGGFGGFDGNSVSNFANTGSGSTGVSDGPGVGGVYTGSGAFAGGFPGAGAFGGAGGFPGAGAFAGAGGFPGAGAFAGPGVFVGGMNPMNMFAPGFPFNFLGRR